MIRRSRAGSFSNPPRYDPKPAPICAIGPSRPADPPVPSVIADAIVLIIGMRPRISPRLLWKASIAASVPWPSASGAKV